MKKIISFIGTSLLTTSMLLTVSMTPSSALADANLANPPDSTYISPEIDLNGPRVYSEEEQENFRQKRGTPDLHNWYKAFAPTAGIWKEFRATQSLWGTNNDVKKTYQFAAYGSAPVCVQGMGWQNNRHQYWVGAGCSLAGDFTVHWGNVAAYPTVKATSTRPGPLKFAWI